MTTEALKAKAAALRDELEAPSRAEAERRAELAKLEQQISDEEAAKEKAAAKSRLEGLQGAAAACDGQLAAALKAREKALKALEAADAAINSACAEKAETVHEARNMAADYDLPLPAMTPVLLPASLGLRMSRVQFLTVLPKRPPNRREREQAEQRAAAEAAAHEKTQRELAASFKQAGVRLPATAP